MRPIDQFLVLAGAEVAATATEAARAAGVRVAELLAAPPEPARPPPPQRLAVCRFLGAACAEMRRDFAVAFEALEPQLAWQARAIPDGLPGFAEGHASSRLLDRNGLEQRGGLVAGFSLVAPGVSVVHGSTTRYFVISMG